MKYQIDIETLSTKMNAVVMSVGICNADGKGDQIFLPKQSQLHANRHVSGETFEWWQQPERAEYFSVIRDECYKAYEENVQIQDVHDFITAFLATNDDKETREIWMNDPDFDGIVLKSLFDDFALDVPWHYRDLRSFRTLKNLALKKNPDISLSDKPAGVHDALVDCQWQMQRTHFYLMELGL